MRTPLLLLLLAAVVGGCILPESTLVEPAAKGAAPAQRKADDGDSAARGLDVVTRPDAAQRDPNDAGCDADQDDAGSNQGACCTEPAPCYDGAKATLAVGRCHAGMRACQLGRLGACENSVLPRPETCDNQGSDDDCDGQLDNVPSVGAACTPAQSANACGGGAFGCVAQRAEPVCVPDAAPTELCNEQDDDCDMKVDETFDLMTDVMHCGSCDVRCESAQVCCSGRCSVRGGGSNGCERCSAMLPCDAGKACCTGACVDWQTDSNNCGACGMACGQNQACCSGKCMNINADAANCGACGTVCDMGMMPKCCAGACVDLAADRRNCGACGNNCGVVCTCELNSGEPQCMGPLAVCF